MRKFTLDSIEGRTAIFAPDEYPVRRGASEVFAVLLSEKFDKDYEISDIKFVENPGNAAKDERLNASVWLIHDTNVRGRWDCPDPEEVTFKVKLKRRVDDQPEISSEDPRIVNQ